MREQSTVDIINAYKQRQSGGSGGAAPRGTIPPMGGGTPGMTVSMPSQKTVAAPPPRAPMGGGYSPKAMPAPRGGAVAPYAPTVAAAPVARYQGDKKSPAAVIVITLVLAIILTVSAFFMGYFLAKPKDIEGAGAVPAPQLVLNTKDGVLTWDAVSKAVTYSLFVDNKEYLNIRSTTVTLSNYTDASDNIVDGSRIVSLRIRTHTSDKVSGFSNTVYYGVDNGGSQQNKLSSPSNLRVEGSNFAWNAVDNARRYEAAYNKDGGSVQSLQVSGTTASIESQLQSPGSYVFKVRALANSSGDNSDFATLNYTVNDPATKLDTPTGLSFDNNTNTLSWNSVQNAIKFEIQVGKNAGDLTTITTPNNTPNYEVSLAPGNYVFSVKALGNGTQYADSDASGLTNFVVNEPDTNKPPLATPNPSVNQSAKSVSWAAVSGASSYSVEVDGTQNSVSTTTYSLASLTDTSHTYQIRVKAKASNTANNTDSGWSSIVTYTPSDSKPMLVTPSIYVLDKTLNWGRITGANKYIVSITPQSSGTEQTADTTDTRFDLSGYNQNTTYVLKVKAIAQDPNANQDSEWSQPVNYLPGQGGELSGDTSPDAVESRIRATMSQSEYESQFQYRFGSPNWKKYPHWYYASQGVEKYTDYYSYETLIAAARFAASKMLKIEYRDATGIPDGLGGEYGVLYYTQQFSVIDKTTMQETLIAPGVDFNASHNLNKPIFEQTVDMGTFMLSYDGAGARDLAGFLANMSHEVGGGDIFADGPVGFLETGLYFNEELGYLDWDKDPNNPVLGYISTEPGAQYFPAQPGQSYHGRGPVQLSWNYNYGLISGELFGDVMVLLKDSDMILDQDFLGFATGILYWMTPQAPKPSCSDVMTHRFKPTQNDID
ncbi:MAG: chitinase, partial [Firmicutes bacterium]|nr:chitinase [Bacillota bacterium]